MFSVIEKVCVVLAAEDLLVLSYNAIPVKGVTRVTRRILIWLLLVEATNTLNQCLFQPSCSG